MRLVALLLALTVPFLVGAAAAARAETPPDAALIENLRQLGARAGDLTYRIPSASMEPTLHCPRPGTRM